MYSLPWFHTFGNRVAPRATAAEVAAVLTHAPPSAYPRLLDVGCGTGRIAAPLADSGYTVYGIDVSVDALRTARTAAPAAHFIALDQRHIGCLRWIIDVVVVFWNSIGFADRATDIQTLRGVHDVLRPGGRLLLDLYHPDWLVAHQLHELADPRGASVTRWVERGRCHHHIRYPDGTVDDMKFNIYSPDEIKGILRAARLVVDGYRVRWRAAEPGAEHARYQVVATRPA